MTSPADEALQKALNREVSLHEAAAERCRRERRAVWLRLFEAGYKYERLGEITGYGQTTIFTELKRARVERNGDGEG